MSVEFNGKYLFLNNKSIKMSWSILDSFEIGNKIIVLFDPDEYLLDPTYKEKRRQGTEAYRNLVAISEDGHKIWEAEFPEKADYYYRVASKDPLIVNSFSSFECEIDIETGCIRKKTFVK